MYQVTALSADGKNQASQRSAAVFFSIALPSPLGDIKTTTPTFSWAAIPGATSYTLQLADLDAGTVQSQTSITGTSWKPSQPLDKGHAYAWLIIANNAAKTKGVSTSFTVAP